MSKLIKIFFKSNLTYSQKLDFKAVKKTKHVTLISTTDPNAKHPGIDYFFIRGWNLQMEH